MNLESIVRGHLNGFRMSPIPWGRALDFTGIFRCRVCSMSCDACALSNTRGRRSVSMSSVAKVRRSLYLRWGSAMITLSSLVSSESSLTSQYHCHFIIFLSAFLCSSSSDSSNTTAAPSIPFCGGVSSCVVTVLEMWSIFCKPSASSYCDSCFWRSSWFRITFPPRLSTHGERNWSII